MFSYNHTLQARRTREQSALRRVRSVDEPHAILRWCMWISVSSCVSLFFSLNSLARFFLSLFLRTATRRCWTRLVLLLSVYRTVLELRQVHKKFFAFFFFFGWIWAFFIFFFYLSKYYDCRWRVASSCPNTLRCKHRCVRSCRFVLLFILFCFCFFLFFCVFVCLCVCVCVCVCVCEQVSI